MSRKQSRKKKTQRDQEVLYNNRVISIDQERENRRQRTKRRAEAKRKRQGRQSIREKMLAERAVTDPMDTSREAVKTIPVKKKKERRPLSPQAIIAMATAVVIVIILLLSIGKIISLQQQKNEINSEIEQMQQQIKDLEAKTEDIDSDEYIEQEARNWLKMAKSGEMVYVMKGNALEQEEGVTEADEKAQANQNTTDDEL